MNERHKSALFVVPLLVASGCFLGHGRDGEERRDAGTMPRVDAGPGCGIEAVPAQIVECPPSTVAAGTDVAVQVEHGTRRCCDATSPRTSVAHAGREHTITAEWTLCECCDECDCVGPSQTDRVSLGILDLGMHTVHAGETSCVFRVEELACSIVEADEVRAPAVLFSDQSFSTAIRLSMSAGCSCSPRAMEASGGVLLSLCDCCDGCECIDPGYEVGYTRGPLSVGEHSLALGGREHRVTVYDRDTCHPGEATGLEIVGPDPMLISGGERLWWAVLRGTESLCCVEPAPAVEHTRAGTTFDLSLSSCAIDPCACVGTPRAFEAWHSLGELTSGTYTARIGAHVQSFTVDGR